MKVSPHFSWIRASNWLPWHKDKYGPKSCIEPGLEPWYPLLSNPQSTSKPHGFKQEYSFQFYRLTGQFCSTQYWLGLLTKHNCQCLGAGCYQSSRHGHFPQMSGTLGTWTEAVKGLCLSHCVSCPQGLSPSTVPHLPAQE